MTKGYTHIETIHNKQSSDIILPLLAIKFSFNSILDIGCGIGTWLASAKGIGVETVFGVDGNYVDTTLLKKFLNLNFFLAHDLRDPLLLKRQFDLTICLEVAEHLPEYSAATLVKSLVMHSEVILFSAAIPGQGGQYHLNEQWPDYWAQLFATHGYVFLDIIRPLIWNNPKVDYWYKQNIFLVVKSNHELASKHTASHLPLVHPELLNRIAQNKDKQINSLKKQLAIHPLKRWIRSIIK